MANWVNPNQTASNFMTVGTEFNAYNYSMNTPKVVYGGSGRFVVGWNDAGGVGSYGCTVRGCVWNGSAYVMSGWYSSPYTGSANSNANRKEHIDMAYHTANSKVIAVFKNQPLGAHGQINVGTWTGSGTSSEVSWGTPSTWAAGAIRHPQVVVDDNTGKIVVVYYNDSTNTWYSKVGVLSGSSVTFGSAVQISTVQGHTGASEPAGEGYSLIYVPGLQVVQFHWNGYASGAWKGYTATGTVSSSSSTITWSNVGVYFANGQNKGVTTFAPTPDTTNNRIFLFASDASYGDTGRYKSQSLSSAVTNLTNARHFLGFADQAYTNGQTATIKTYGNTVSTLSGLSIGQRYFVQGDGTVGTNFDSDKFGGFTTNTPVAGTALSATKLLIRDPNAAI
jgi:hypothetical protein